MGASPPPSAPPLAAAFGRGLALPPSSAAFGRGFAPPSAPPHAASAGAAKKQRSGAPLHTVPYKTKPTREGWRGSFYLSLRRTRLVTSSECTRNAKSGKTPYYGVFLYPLLRAFALHARRVFYVSRHCGASHARARVRLSALPLALWRACPSFCKGRARFAVALPPLQTLPHALGREPPQRLARRLPAPFRGGLSPTLALLVVGSAGLRLRAPPERLRCCGSARSTTPRQHRARVTTARAVPFATHWQMVPLRLWRLCGVLRLWRLCGAVAPARPPAL